MDDHTLDANTGDLRRIEVITGTGRRRRWSAETKAQIIAESFTGEASVSEVGADTGFDPSGCLAGAIMPGTDNSGATAETRRHLFR